MLRPDLAQLEALLAVVDTGSFEAAARTLHVTPSAISQRMRALETSAGSVLLQRSKPVVATATGEAWLRLARQVRLLVGDTVAAAGDDKPVVALAVNADSLATWALPALATVGADVQLDVRREDQAHTATLLREGVVMAAITSEPVAVQGCTVTPLGVMRYRPTASTAFAARWFAAGARREAFATAPAVIFDRRDVLQDEHLASLGIDPASVPRHHIPGSQDFAEAVRLGLGWGMLPDLQTEASASGDLVRLGRTVVDVPLHWQQWSIETPSLERVADAVITAARTSLRRAS
jgi:LysR family transcriptional regulator (chromosome initiation inhibitor)